MPNFVPSHRSSERGHAGRGPPTAATTSHLAQIGAEGRDLGIGAEAGPVLPALGSDVLLPSIAVLFVASLLSPQQVRWAALIVFLVSVALIS